MARTSFAARQALFAGIGLLCSLSFLTSSAHGFAHFWEITEVYSNASGSVQFVEMFDFSPGENFVQGTTLDSDSDGDMESYTFPSNIDLSKNTANHHLLIATPGFAALSGVTPDYTFPAGLMLFNPNATNITISFSASGSELSSTLGTFPRNGILSLNSTGIASNTPTNFNGSVGHLVPEPAAGVLMLAVCTALSYAFRRRRR